MIPDCVIEAVSEAGKAYNHWFAHKRLSADSFREWRAFVAGWDAHEAAPSEPIASHPRDKGRPAYPQAMVELLDAYEQQVWVWAHGCKTDDISQRSAVEDSYNEYRRDDVAEARSALIRQIDALTTARVTPAGASMPDDALEPLRPEVLAFARLMEAQLRANDHKPGWKDERAANLVKRLYDEVSELHQATIDGVNASLEAADVANFAMMIADVCDSLATNAPEVTDA